MFNDFAADLTNMGKDNLYKSPSFYSTGITNVPCLFFQLITRIIRILKYLKYPFVKFTYDKSVLELLYATPVTQMTSDTSPTDHNAELY